MSALTLLKALKTIFKAIYQGNATFLDTGSTV